MKNKIIFSLLILSTIVFACKKDNETTPSSNGSGGGTTCANGIVYFKNNEADPYKIYIDNNLQGTLNPGTTSSGFSVSPNIGHELKAVQASGYIFYPTEYSTTQTCSCGATVSYSF